MKQLIKHFLGGAVLLALPMFLTSCDDILGQWDKPAPTSIVLSQGTPTISITADDLKLYVDDTDTRIGTASTGATVNYASSDESIATVDANGKVTAVGVGTATITASVDPTEKFTGASATYNVIVSKIDVRLNPLYYVAEYNVQDFNTTTKVVTFDSDPASLTDKRVYMWSNAMTNFAKQDGDYDIYWDGNSNSKKVTDASESFYYHLPCLQEWNTVLPGDFSSYEPWVDWSTPRNSNPNVFDTGFYPNGGYTHKLGDNSSKEWPDVYCIFGYDATTKGGILDNSYWNTITAQSDVRYGIRFLGTKHCSIWKYQSIELDPIDATHNQCKLVVTAKIIDQLEKTDASLESILAEYMAKDDEWWNYNNPNAGAVQREFYSQGSFSIASGGATPAYSDYANKEQWTGHYWSTTNGNRDETGSYLEARVFDVSKNNAGIGSQTRTNYWCHHFSVRLFREPKE